MRIVDASSLRYVCKSSVAVVVEEKIARAFQAPGTALYWETAILTDFAGTKFGKVVEIQVNVVRDKEVLPSVAIVIAESGAGGELCIHEASLLGYIREGAVAVVTVEDDSA